MSIEKLEQHLLNYSEKQGRRKFFIQHDFSMKRITSFHIGGNCDLAVYPSDEESFAFALEVAEAEGVDYIVIGNGSNTLALDGGFRGVVFVTTDMRKVEIIGEHIRGGCGVLLGSIGTNASHNSLSGAEFANGIPGTLGGSVYMNAGAYGGQFSDIVEESRCYDLDSKKIITLNASEHEFGYRQSIFMRKKYIILSTLLKLSHGSEEEIKEKMRANLQARRDKQPLEYPSAGSVFKRPEGHFAGKLIEDAGLKGKQIGGAAVSPKHAGFIVNLGDATASDVLELIDFIKERVYQTSKVELECEIRFVGEK